LSRRGWGRGGEEEGGRGHKLQGLLGNYVALKGGCIAGKS